jgi:hypothetical protein
MIRTFALPITQDTPSEERERKKERKESSLKILEIQKLVANIR